jgi:hypothetical protein
VTKRYVTLWGSDLQRLHRERSPIDSLAPSLKVPQNRRVGKNPSEKEAMMMTLGELLQQLCAQTTLDTSRFNDLNVVPLPSSPDCLKDSTGFCSVIWTTTFQAALLTGLSGYGAWVFGGWLANSCTEQARWFLESGSLLWNANKNTVLRDISRLDAAFGQAVFGNPTTVFRLFLLPDWNALPKHLSQIQRGVTGPFEEAKKLGGV